MLDLLIVLHNMVSLFYILLKAKNKMKQWKEPLSVSLDFTKTETEIEKDFSGNK